jgi:hypothetical protein
VKTQRDGILPLVSGVLVVKSVFPRCSEHPFVGVLHLYSSGYHVKLISYRSLFNSLVTVNMK